MTPSSVRILIVDEKSIWRSTIQFALEEKGFKCDLANDGVQAQQFLAQHHYDVVVTDLILPRTNGAELVIKLCAQWPCPIIVIAHSSVLDSEVVEGLKREGVNEIVNKSIGFSKLADRIQDLVKSRRSLSLGIVRWSPTELTTRTTQAARMFARGDEWIQNRPHRIETFRFGMVILACILFGLGWGHSLTSEMAGVCRMFGLCGLAFYFCLELVAYYRERNRAMLLRHIAEQRLATKSSLRADNAAATLDRVPMNSVIA